MLLISACVFGSIFILVISIAAWKVGFCRCCRGKTQQGGDKELNKEKLMKKSQETRAEDEENQNMMLQRYYIDNVKEF